MALQTYRGVIHGNAIELDARPELPEGATVQVLIVPEGELRPGSPVAVLRALVGTLTPEEASALRDSIAEMRTLSDDEVPAGY